MSVHRIVRKRLLNSGEVKRDGHKWIDKRPRDKYGVLQGYCSEMEAKRREGRANHARPFI